MWAASPTCTPGKRNAMCDNNRSCVQICERVWFLFLMITLPVTGKKEPTLSWEPGSTVFHLSAPSTNLSRENPYLLFDRLLHFCLDIVTFLFGYNAFVLLLHRYIICCCCCLFCSYRRTRAAKVRLTSSLAFFSLAFFRLLAVAALEGFSKQQICNF